MKRIEFKYHPNLYSDEIMIHEEYSFGAKEICSKQQHFVQRTRFSANASNELETLETH